MNFSYQMKNIMAKNGRNKSESREIIWLQYLQQ